MFRVQGNSTLSIDWLFYIGQGIWHDGGCWRASSAPAKVRLALLSLIAEAPQARLRADAPTGGTLRRNLYRQRGHRLCRRSSNSRTRASSLPILRKASASLKFPIQGAGGTFAARKRQCAESGGGRGDGPGWPQRIRPDAAENSRPGRTLGQSSVSRGRRRERLARADWPRCARWLERALRDLDNLSNSYTSTSCCRRRFYASTARLQVPRSTSKTIRERLRDGSRILYHDAAQFKPRDRETHRDSVIVVRLDRRGESSPMAESRARPPCRSPARRVSAVRSRARGFGRSRDAG